MNSQTNNTATTISTPSTHCIYIYIYAFPIAHLTESIVYTSLPISPYSRAATLAWKRDLSTDRLVPPIRKMSEGGIFTRASGAGKKKFSAVAATFASLERRRVCFVEGARLSARHSEGNMYRQTRIYGCTGCAQRAIIANFTRHRFY